MSNGILLCAVLLFGTNYNSCSASAEDDCGSETAARSSNNFGDWSISINETEYCFVNECTIRIKESNVLLNIINKTADWIAAANKTNLFTVPVTGNDSVNYNCSLQDDPNVSNFIFYAVVAFIIITSSSLNIFLHFAVKELRSTPGFIIVGICGAIIAVYLTITTTAVFQYLQRVNGNTIICGVLKYITVYFTVIYIILKATYLFHFACLMYRTYRCRPYKETNKKLLYIYGAVTITASTICSALNIILDHVRFRTAFNTDNGYCTRFFDKDRTSDSLYSNYPFLLPLFTIITAAGIAFFIIGLTLYYLTTECSCTFCGTKGPNDVRVSITLISATALGVLILVILLLAGVRRDRSLMTASIGVCVEQVVLAVVFLTSKKTRNKLKKCFQTVAKSHHTAGVPMQERFAINYIAVT